LRSTLQHEVSSRLVSSVQPLPNRVRNRVLSVLRITVSHVMLVFVQGQRVVFLAGGARLAVPFPSFSSLRNCFWNWLVVLHILSPFVAVETSWNRGQM